MALVTVQQLDLKPQETAFYDYLFRLVDKTTTPGKLSGAAIKDLFTKSKIEKKTLALIWNVADQQKRKYLTRDDFFIALRLIVLAQQGKPTTLQMLTNTKNVPLPVFEGISPPPPAPSPTYMPPPLPPSPVVPAPLSSTSSWGMTNEWTITEAERANLQRHFPSADKDNDGYVSGKEASTFFRQSQLPNPLLKKIWLLSDVNKDNRLDREEFVIAMFLVNKARKGVLIPEVLPTTLLPNNGRADHSLTSGGLPALESPTPTAQIDMLESFTKKPTPSAMDPGKAASLDDLLAPIRDDDPVVSLTPTLTAPKPVPTPVAPSPVVLSNPRRTSLISSGSGDHFSTVASTSGGSTENGLDLVSTPPLASGGGEYGTFDMGGRSGSGSIHSLTGGTQSLSPSNSFSSGLPQVPPSSSFSTPVEVQRVQSQRLLVKDTAVYTESKFTTVDDERKDYGQKLAEQADLLNAEQTKLRELQLQLTEANRELVTSKELLSVKKRELEETKRQRESFENQISLVKKQIHDANLEVDLIDQQLIQLRVNLKVVEELKQNQEAILQARRDKQAELRRERADITELLEKSRLEMKKLKETSNLLQQGIQVQTESNQALREQVQDTLTILKEDQAFLSSQPTKTVPSSSSNITTPASKPSVPLPSSQTSSQPSSQPSSSPTKSSIPPSSSTIPAAQKPPTDENFMKKLDDQFSVTEFDTELLKEGVGEVPDWDTFGGTGMDGGDSKGTLGSGDDIFENAADWDTDFATTSSTSAPLSPPVTTPSKPELEAPSPVKSPPPRPEPKENDRKENDRSPPIIKEEAKPSEASTSNTFDDGFGDIPAFSTADDLTADASAFDFPGSASAEPTPGADFGSFGFGEGASKPETKEGGQASPQIEGAVTAPKTEGEGEFGSASNDDPFAVSKDFDELDFGADAGTPGAQSETSSKVTKAGELDGWAAFD